MACQTLPNLRIISGIGSDGNRQYSLGLIAAYSLGLIAALIQSARWTALKFLPLFSIYYFHNFDFRLYKKMFVTKCCVSTVKYRCYVFLQKRFLFRAEDLLTNTYLSEVEHHFSNTRVYVTTIVLNATHSKSYTKTNFCINY